MKKIIYKSDTRGHANHGWLNSHHTFSFANYFNPERIQFGLLRVVNDDKVAPSMGFGTHPHKDMEIISIPLKGVLAHKDSMGNVHNITPGEVQVMTAGTGITHSEYNGSESENVEFFQIWVFPRANNLTPSYDQKRYNAFEQDNKLTVVVSPDGKDESLQVQQDTWFSLGKFDATITATYKAKKEGNGLFFMVVEGEVEIAGEVLSKRDAIGIYDTNDAVTFKALSNDTKVLIIDVPME